MKLVAITVAGLVCMTAGAVHAQDSKAQGSKAQAPGAPKAGAPTPVAPAVPAAPPASDRSCVLVTQTGDQYAEQPLPGFDPAVTSQPLPPITAANAAMIVCIRTTIIPEVTDYRVLTELRLPLSIRVGQKTLFLGASGGKLQAGMPEGEATAEDTKAVQDRLDEMNDAMAKALAKKKK
jgi:hypothetical protein